MSVTLEIKANAQGVETVLNGVKALIEAAEKSTARLAATTLTIRDHWRNISTEVSTYRKLLDGISTTTQDVAKNTVAIGSGFQSSIAGAQRLSAEMAKIRENAIQTARTLNSIRIPSSGFGRTTTTGVVSPTIPVTPIAPTAPTGTSAGGGFFSDRARQSYGAGLGSTGLADLAGSAISSTASTIQSVIGRSLRFAWREFEVAGIASAAIVATFVGSSISKALDAQPIKTGFANLAGANGLGDEVKLLEELRKAARGTVSDLDLMTSTNKALMLGATRTSEELKLLISGGRILGKAMGVDATEGYERLVTGIGRHSSMILDDLGLIVRSQEAYEKYAKIHGTTTDKLSEEEKQLIFTTAAYDALRQHVKEQGDEQDAATEKVARAKTAFSNLSTSFGEKFLQSIGEVADRWTAFLGTMNADDVESKMTGAMNAIVEQGKKVSEFFLPKDLASDVGNLAGDIWKAFTDPSDEAFKIVELRFEQLWNTIKQQFETFWVKVTTSIAGIPVALEGAVGLGIKAITFGAVDQIAEDAGRKADKILQAQDAPERSRIAENKTIDLQIESLRRQMKKASQNAPSQNTPTGTLASAPGTPVVSNEQRLAVERSRREESAAAEAAAKAQREAEKQAEKALREEIRAREEMIRTIEDQQKKTRVMIDDLEGARANAAAAFRGEDDPTRSIPQRLDALAGELRSFPITFQQIGEKLKTHGEEMAKAMRDWQESLDKAFSEIDQSILHRANSFLQEAPQDGETVRVRAMKRRAQRDLKRRNTALVNDAFRSGADNYDPTQSPLDQRFPSLERALLQLRNPDGTTQAMQIQERIATMVSEHAKQVEAARDEERKILAEQEKAHAAMIKVQDDTNALMQIAVDQISTLTSGLAERDRQIQQLRKELERVARLVKR